MEQKWNHKDRSIRWYDYITINIFWFGKATRNQALSTLIIPLLVQQFMGEALKGSYLGIIRLWGLMAALLVQALMGMVSDHRVFKWGKRRPFILFGTIAEIFVLIGIGFSVAMEGVTGFWVLFVLYLLSMIASDTGQGAAQGLIPDLVPEERLGQFSGVKALLELPLPLIFTSFVVSKMVSNGNYKGALVTVMIVLSVCMGVSMLTQEYLPQRKPDRLDWQPFLRLVTMTGIFTLIILGMGAIVKLSISLLGTQFHTQNGLVLSLIGLLCILIAIVLGVILSVSIAIEKNSDLHNSYIAWIINRLAFLVGAVNLSGFMIYFLQERFSELTGNLAAGPASILIMYVGISILISTLPSGWLTDRFGQKPLIISAGIAAVSGTLVVLIAPAMEFIYYGGCLIGAGIGIFFTSSWALGTKIVPKQDAGKYLGVSNLAGAGAGAVGAYIGGPIADSVGYVPLYIVYGALFIISMLVLKWVKD